MQVTVPALEHSMEKTHQLLPGQTVLWHKPCWEYLGQKEQALRLSAAVLQLSKQPTKLGGLLLHHEEKCFKEVSEVNLYRKTASTERLFLSLLCSQKPYLQLHKDQPYNARQKNVNSCPSLFPSRLPFSPLQGITTFKTKQHTPSAGKAPK